MSSKINLNRLADMREFGRKLIQKSPSHGGEIRNQLETLDRLLPSKTNFASKLPPDPNRDKGIEIAAQRLIEAIMDCPA